MSVYPLSAIVGQEALVEALLVNAVAPEIGGVLVRGERGTAKSTAVRALAPLLPPVHAAAGEAFCFAPGEPAPGGVVAPDAPVVERPAPLVELPLGATLDRLVGALDLGRALAGEAAFEPGLLARAHRGILYVDEVNLLPDHLVDALLDSAASGVARVEREAVSVEHAARFQLVGTMNAEEGELRPQLLDRFGLGVEVRAPRDAAVRAEIVRRRLAFERDPEAFAEQFRGADAALAARIAAARDLLPSVRLPEHALLRIAGACAALAIDGVRGDIVTARAACALAALDGVDEVDETHVRRAAALALPHRRRDPLDGSTPDRAEIERALDDDEPPEPEPPRPSDPRQSVLAERDEVAGAAGPPARAARERRDPPAPAGLPPAALALDGRGAGPSGRRGRSAGREAGAIDSRPGAAGEDMAVVATLLHGTPRAHVRAGREGALICLVVDASGSMGARRRLAKVKGALLALLRDAYARRDRVAVVAFRADDAEVVVAPGAPLERAAAAIRSLPTGGRTPLADGLDVATRLLVHARAKEPERRALALVLTDGRVHDPDGAVRAAAARLGAAADAVHVVDTEDGPVRLGLAPRIAAAAGGRVHALTSPPARRAA